MIEEEYTPMIEDLDQSKPKRVASSVSLKLINSKVSYALGEHARLSVTVYDQHKKTFANQPYRLTYLSGSKRINQTKTRSKVLFKPPSQGLWSIKACIGTGHCSEVAEVHFQGHALLKELDP